MRRVLVTGAAGFIGRHALMPLRERGFEVYAVDRTRAAQNANDGCVWQTFDLLDRDAVARTIREVSPTHLLHFAWFVKHGEYWTAPENLDSLATSLHLLRAFHQSGGQKVVACGTCAEYIWDTSAGLCIEQQTPLRPQTLYGTSKNALRATLESFSTTWKLDWAWGRVFLPYGFGEPSERLVPSIIRSLAQGDRAVCRSSNLVRDLMHADDVGRAFAALLDSPVIGPVNIASGAPVSLGDAAREVASQMNATDRLDLYDQPCNSSNPARLYASTRRLKEEVGFTPRLSLREGLRQTIQAMCKDFETNALSS